MESIKLWFNGTRDYQEGVDLYTKFGTDQGLRKLLTMEGETPFKKKRLLEALEALISEAKEKPPVDTSKAPKAPPRAKDEVTPEKSWSKVRDEVEQSLYLKWKPVYLEMVNLCSRLDEVARAGQKDPNKKEEAGRMALRILELEQQCDSFYRSREYYHENKNLPQIEEPYQDFPVDPALAFKAFQNAQKYARDYRAKLRKYPDNPNYAAQLRKWESAVQAYKSKFNF